MGKEWEKHQLDTLVEKQKLRIAQLEKNVISNPALVNEQLAVEEKKSPIISGITLIAAAGENDAIGKDNELIWNLPDDLKRFKSLTSGHCMIMGRKTFETFEKPLPNRTHIIITRQQNYSVPEGVIVVHDLKAALELAKGDQQPFVIGGGEIYKQAMSFANIIELTRVHDSFQADTFFPKIDSSIWKETNSVFHPKDAEHAYSFSFLTFERSSI